MTTTDEPCAVQFTRCPECGLAAEIVRRAVLESTDGPIEHSAVRCVAAHQFLLSTASLASPPGHPEHRPVARSAARSSRRRGHQPARGATDRHNPH